MDRSPLGSAISAAGAAAVMGEAAARAGTYPEGDRDAHCRALIASMSDGFALHEIVCDARGEPVDYRFLDVNSAFERLTGLRRGDVVGRLMSEVLPGDDPRWVRTCGEVALTGRPVHVLRFVPVLGRHFDVFAFCPERGRFAALFADVTERREREEALRRSEAVLAQAGEMARLGAWWIDFPVAGEIESGRLHWSDETYRLFGYAPGEVEVTNALFFEHVPPDERQAVANAVERAIAERRPYSIEHRIRRADGAERVVLEHAEISFDERGRTVRMVGAVQDVTEQKRAEQELREADRRKDEFLSVLSHELRNPLAPLRNSVYVLENADPAGEPARRARAVIARQVGHLTRLVDDLLDVTRVARGRIGLRRERLDLNAIVRRSGEDHRAVMLDRGIELEVEVPREVLWVNGDATRLSQVIGNLLQNAAKFTGRGGRVNLVLAARGPRAEIRVRDTGVGIEPGLLARVFEPFVQADRTLARTEGGLGLGLSLVKGLTDLHGGAVRAESEGAGKGAEFVVELPLVAPEREDEPRPAWARAGPRGRRVLVVDDNVDAAESLAQLIELLGHSTEVAHDGREAMAKARASPPDVVLCDLGLPGMNGFEVARAIRADPALAGIELVAVSGYAQPEDRRAAAEAGFDAHVAKPADPDTIARLLG
jgi:PAS domain S-box-containing protein